MDAYFEQITTQSIINFLISNEYDTDAIKQDLKDCDDQIENENISNILNISNKKDVSLIFQLMINDKCMLMIFL